VSDLNTDFWRRCSSCKAPIKYSSAYFVCSVSTCNRKRIGYVFDSVHCWERHLPGARHRDAAAVEAKAPTYDQWKAELETDGGGVETQAAQTSVRPAFVAPNSAQQAAAVAQSRTPQRVIVKPAASGSNLNSASMSNSTIGSKPPYKDSLESEILVVVSKLKNYVRERSEMNTSDSVINVLSARLRRLCDRAIENARNDGRKTIMDRDFENL
jgi:histone H3/H4